MTANEGKALISKGKEIVRRRERESKMIMYFISAVWSHSRSSKNHLTAYYLSMARTYAKEK